MVEMNSDCRRLLDALPNCIIVIDFEFSICFRNRAFTAQWRLDELQVIGRKCFDVLSGSPRASSTSRGDSRSMKWPSSASIPNSVRDPEKHRFPPADRPAALPDAVTYAPAEKIGTGIRIKELYS